LLTGGDVLGGYGEWLGAGLPDMPTATAIGRDAYLQQRNRGLRPQALVSSQAEQIERVAAMARDPRTLIAHEGMHYYPESV
jgi:hypothetical protein